MGKTDDMRASYMLGLRIMVDFGATIAIPAVLAAVLGVRLDTAWGTGPYILIASLLIAFGLTALVIRRKVIAYGKEYQKLVEKN
jgi:F0F1-type ATP synthase assembly protein I